MRSWASSAASAALLTAVLAAAAPAAAAPVDDFARATGAVRLAIQAATPRAEAAGQVRRDAALECLDLLRATPEANREALANAYFLDVALGLFTVDGPVYRRWLDRLEGLRLRHEPALMAARRVIRGQVALVDAFELGSDPICAVATEWQAAHWRTPPRSIRLQRRLIRIVDSASQETDAAEARLRRAGHPRAAHILSVGIDESDERVERRDDPVRIALEGNVPE